MVNFTIDNQGTNTFLVTEISKNSKLDTVGIGMIQNNKIVGLAPLSYLTIDNVSYLRFNVSSQITLSNLLRGRTDKRQFLEILKNLLSTINSLGDYMMEPQYLMLSAEHIYVNVGSLQTAIIYYPVVENREEQSIKDFFKNLIMNLEFSPNEDNSYVARIINYLNGQIDNNASGMLALVEDLIREGSGMQSRVVQPQRAMAPMNNMNASLNTPIGMNSAPVGNGNMQIPNNVSHLDAQNNNVQIESPEKEKKKFGLFKKKEKNKNNSQENVMQNAPMPGVPIPGAPMQSENTTYPKPIGPNVVIPGTNNMPKTPMNIPGREDKGIPMPNPISNEPKGKGKKQKENNKKNIPNGTPVPMINNQIGNGHNMNTQVIPNQSIPMHSMPGQSMPTQVMSGQSMPTQVMPGQSMPTQVMSGQSMPTQVMPGQSMPTQVMPGQSMPTQVMPNQSISNTMPAMNAPVMNQTIKQQANDAIDKKMNLGGTITLDDSSTRGTMVLMDDNDVSTKRALLLRNSTGEKIYIDKPLFRLGKERNFCDYTVTDNPTISRSHADIINENGQYFIVDNNSLNHTFVNDNQITSQTKVKLENRTVVKLSNEIFEFKFE